MLEDGSRQGQAVGTQEIGALYAAHAGYVGRVLRRFGVAEHDVPDVTHDVFVIVCRKLDGFEGRSSVRTWLYRICARTAIDHHRRAHRRYERLTDPPESAGGETQMDEVATRRTAHVVRAALDELGDDKRAVFVLYEIEEMSMAEIALVLRCPLQTAFSRLYAARRHVNKALARAGWVGSALAVGMPARTAWAALPELRAVVEAWRATLPGAFTLAKLGAQGSLSAYGAASLAAAACIAAIAASFGPSAHAPADAVLHRPARVGVLSAVVVHEAVDVGAPSDALPYEPVALRR